MTDSPKFADIERLHSRSMELAERAFMQRQPPEEVRQLFLKAYEFESAAAEMLTANIDYEPTRSILFRSAAALALRCGLQRQAEVLIAKGLSGNPPIEVAEELRDLMEDVFFARHLQFRGYSLDPSEINLSIWGTLVGHGKALYADFLDRSNHFTALVYRTIERKKGLPFRELGLVPREIQKEYRLVLASPMPGSFNVTFQLASKIPKIPELDETPAIVDELIESVAEVNSGNLSSLEKRIVDPLYRKNLVSLVTHLYPNGETVQNVNITVNSHGNLRNVLLQKKPQSLIEPENVEAVHALEPPRRRLMTVPVQLQGVLQEADSRRKKKDNEWGSVILVEDNGNQVTVRVPIELMSDIVKPYYESLVTIDANMRGKKYTLVDINPMN